MKMSTYYPKKRYAVGFALLFSLCLWAGLDYLFIKNDFGKGILLIICSLILIYSVFKIATECIIIITDEFIKIKTFKKEEMCNWGWIRSIRTKKYSYPNSVYYTYINWSKIIEHQQEYLSMGGNEKDKKKGELVIASYYSHYEQIIADIVLKTKCIDIDETTRKIVEKVSLNK
jgi:hypothetical protein